MGAICGGGSAEKKILERGNHFSAIKSILNFQKSVKMADFGPFWELYFEVNYNALGGGQTKAIFWNYISRLS